MLASSYTDSFRWPDNGGRGRDVGREREREREREIWTGGGGRERVLQRE